MRIHGFNGALPVMLMAISCGRCDDDGPTDDSVLHSESDSGIEDADQDGSPAGQDCDDNNPSVYPGAEEVCDGVDNDCNEFIDDVTPRVDACDGRDDDCDGMIDEDGLAVFESEGGELFDYSTELLGATASDPLQVTLSDAGEFRICGGDRRFLLIDISSSVHVVPADPSLVTEISAGDVGGTVVNVTGDSSSTVIIEDISIRDGIGDCIVETRLTGGGICCIGDLRLELLNVTIEDNSAGSGRIGGGMMTQGCTVVLEDSLVTGNVATGGGGGVFVAGGELMISNSTFTYNESNGGGGSAIGARSYYDSATSTELLASVVMRDSVVSHNLSSQTIMIGRYTSLECMCDQLEGCGIFSNDAEFSAMYMGYDSFGFTGTNCDMGSAADGNDNSGPDVYGDDDVAWTADIGNDATFFCSIEQDGCTIE